VTLDYRIEVVTLPVSDVDRAKRFYTEQAGFTLDVDYHPSGATTPASSTSPTRTATPGSSRSAAKLAAIHAHFPAVSESRK
jgi:catechol 2,3-dioxygenase-like lactoylglutathione lyase family enzyme